MLLSLGLVFSIGFVGGWIFEKIRLPKLVFYMLLGILFSPSLLGIVDSKLLDISSYLRQIALIIILTRSGLSLDIQALKKIGRPAILMCFLPATFEIIGICIFAPLLLDISIAEALLMGSVLAAVSPAVVVPRMIKLHEQGYSQKSSLPELIMAGASCDDIYVIVLFYSFKGLVSSQTIDYMSFLQIPVSIILGLLLGIIFALMIVLLFKKTQLPTSLKVIILLGVSFLMVGIEELTKNYVSISSLLGIIVLGIAILKYDKDGAKNIQKSYNGLWQGFEILLFFLVGCAVDIKYALSTKGLVILGLILIGLVFRSIGVLLCIVRTKFDKKERLFIIISYLPKATVQASIGAIALSEGLECGSIVLTSAVIAILLTAPIGAILMDTTYKKLLCPPTPDKIDNNNNIDNINNMDKADNNSSSTYDLQN